MTQHSGIVGRIPFSEIEKATDFFDENNIIGRGVFGLIYRGRLDGRGYGAVAVKRLDDYSLHGKPQFLAEVSTLTTYQHPNINPLIGFCDEDQEMILVYEFNTNVCLDKYLIPKAANTHILTWEIRLKICIGVAKALEYLHRGSSSGYHNVLHRDVKSGKILLDENWEPRLVDFALSRTGQANKLVSYANRDVSQTLISFELPSLTSDAASGTVGYIDPQVLESGTVGDKSDVYSFGVVLFEVLSGRLAYVRRYKDDERNLIDLVRRHIQHGRVDKIVDPVLVSNKNINSSSLTAFSAIAHRCIQYEGDERPGMPMVVRALKYALRLQEGVQDISGLTEKNGSIELSEVEQATNFFDPENFLGRGGFGEVYKGKLVYSVGNMEELDVAVKKLDRRHGHGEHEFLTEITMLSTHKHPNVISLIGFCEEDGHMILVYEYASKGSLNTHLLPNDTSRADLTWERRLEICIGVAEALEYLHRGTGDDKVIHSDLKSANILLDGNWKPKVSDFGSSRFRPLTQGNSYAYTSNVPGTLVYIDPQLSMFAKIGDKSDVYSFGVVLFELLSGRLAFIRRYNDDERNLIDLVHRCIRRGHIDQIVDPCLVNQINPSSLSIFVATAHRCLKFEHDQRPGIAEVLSKLREALKLQETQGMISSMSIAEDRIFNPSSLNRSLFLTAVAEYTSDDQEETDLEVGERVKILFEEDSRYYIRRNSPGKDGKLGGFVPKACF